MGPMSENRHSGVKWLKRILIWYLFRIVVFRIKQSKIRKCQMAGARVYPLVLYLIYFIPQFYQFWHMQAYMLLNICCFRDNFSVKYFFFRGLSQNVVLFALALNGSEIRSFSGLIMLRIDRDLNWSWSGWDWWSRLSLILINIDLDWYSSWKILNQILFEIWI